MTVWRVSLGVGFDSIRFDFVDWVRVRFHFGCSALPAICASRCDDGVSPLLRSSFLSENLLACFGSILFYSARHDATRYRSVLSQNARHLLPTVCLESIVRTVWNRDAIVGNNAPCIASHTTSQHRNRNRNRNETKRHDIQTTSRNQPATNVALRCVLPAWVLLAGLEIKPNFIHIDDASIRVVGCSSSSIIVFHRNVTF